LAIFTGFLVNTALSIGFGLISSWLTPNQQNKAIPEDVPLLGVGSDLYAVWGTSFCPGTLFYFTKPERAGHGDDKSTYGFLSITNPDATCTLEAVRINNLICGSKSPLFTNNVPKTSASDYAIDPVTNLNLHKELGIIFQGYTPVANPNFSINGYNGLQYEGLSWLGVKAAKREIYGGSNARFTLFITNRVDQSTFVPFSVNDDSPVNIETILRVNSGSSAFTVPRPYSYNHGFFGVRCVQLFDTGPKNLCFVGVGGGEEIALDFSDIPPVSLNSVKFKLVGGTGTGGPSLTPGKWPVTSIQSTNPTTSVLLAIEGSPIEEIILSSAGQPPFQSNSGVITDANNSIVHTSFSINAKVIGWGGETFYRFTGPALPANDWPVNAINTEADSPALTGTILKSFVYLSTIIQDLLDSKRPSILINESTPVLVRGFTATFDQPESTIIDLCTVYAKFIYEDGEGIYHLIDYPNGSTVLSITTKDFFDEPNYETSPEIEQPNQIEFSYRSNNDEFSEKAVNVGYGNRSGNTTTIKTNLILNETEARQGAWTVLFLRSHTNTKLVFRTNKIAPQPGTVISVENPKTKLLEKFLIADMEFGQDMTIQYNCVNYVSINAVTPSGQFPVVESTFTPYMLAASAPNIAPPTPLVLTPSVIDAETTFNRGTDFEYGYLRTENTSLATSGSFDGSVSSILGSFFTNRSFTPSTGGIVGKVTGVEVGPINSLEKYISINFTRQPGNNYPMPSNKRLRVGKTWLFYQAHVVETNKSITITGIRTGQYASDFDINLDDWVLELKDENFTSGLTVTGISPNLTRVTQNGQSFNMLPLPAPTIVNSYDNYKYPTVKFPHGRPVSGLCAAQLMSSYYGGRLRIWLSKPGNVRKEDGNGGFFLNDAQDGSTTLDKDWYIRFGNIYDVFNFPLSSAASTFNLGTLQQTNNIPFTVIGPTSLSLLPIEWVIFQALPGFTSQATDVRGLEANSLNLQGSYSFIDYALVGIAKY
jgi:hypothetical protein